MSSTVLIPLADALVEKIEAIGLKGYRFAPRELDELPAGVVEMPAVERTPVDEPEDHLGQKDWKPSFPIIFYFELSVAQQSQDQAVEAIEAFIVAIDEDPSLGGRCMEAKAVEAEVPDIREEEARALIEWPVRVQILKFV